MKPKINFWHDLESNRQYSHEYEALMSHTHTHADFLSFSPLLSFSYTQIHKRAHSCDETWEYEFWGCACIWRSSTNVCLQFPLVPICSPQTHGNLWISIFRKNSWALQCVTEKRVSAISSVVLFFYMLFLIYCICHSLYWRVMEKQQNNTSVVIIWQFEGKIQVYYMREKTPHNY